MQKQANESRRPVFARFANSLGAIAMNICTVRFQRTQRMWNRSMLLANRAFLYCVFEHSLHF